MTVLWDGEYILKKSARAKRARISITKECKVVLTTPCVYPAFLAQRLIDTHRDWIQKKIQKIRESRSGDMRLYRYSREQYEKYREEARSFCRERVAFWAKQMQLEYNRIAIKDMKTRWGSCSSKKNLNFNYKILFLTDAQADYLIVHELAHLVEMNHSPAFWDIVAKYIPAYKHLRTELRKSM